MRGKKPMTARVEDDRNCNTGVTLTVTRARAEQVRKREQASASAAGMLQVCRAVCVRWAKRETVKPEPLESTMIHQSTMIRKKLERAERVERAERERARVQPGSIIA